MTARARHTRSSLALLVACALLAACGQRGPLYLPDQAPKKRLAAPAMSGAAPAMSGAVAASEAAPASVRRP